MHTRERSWKTWRWERRWRQERDPWWDAVPWRRLSLYRILPCRTPCRSLAEIHQIVKRQTRGGERGEGLTHLTTCVRQRALKKIKKNKNAERKSGSVRERAKRSWLVREKSWQPRYLCLSVLKCVCVVSVVDCRGGGEREGVAVDAVSAASGLAAEQWQSNPTGRRAESVRSNSGVACR